MKPRCQKRKVFSYFFFFHKFPSLYSTKKKLYWLVILLILFTASTDMVHYLMQLYCDVGDGLYRRRMYGCQVYLCSYFAKNVSDHADVLSRLKICTRSSNFIVRLKHRKIQRIYSNREYTSGLSARFNS